MFFEVWNLMSSPWNKAGQKDSGTVDQTWGTPTFRDQVEEERPPVDLEEGWVGKEGH